MRAETSVNWDGLRERGEGVDYLQTSNKLYVNLVVVEVPPKRVRRRGGRRQSPSVDGRG